MTYIGSLQGSTSSSGSTASGIGITPGGGISGLASGMNTDAIVSGLVGAAQVPLVELLQQRQVLQWQQEQYQQINSSLSTLQNSASSLQLQSTFLNQTIASSNSGVASATAGNLAVGGSLNVNVTRLAQGATVYSGSALSTNGTNFANQTLSQLGYTSGVTLTINGQSQMFSGTDTINSVLQGISGNTAMGVSGFYDANASEVVLQTAATGSGAMMQVDSTTASFLQNTLKIAAPSNVTTGITTTGTIATAETLKINGQAIQVGTGTAVTTEAQLKAAINNLTAKTGVIADDSSGTLVLKASATLVSPISVSDPLNVLQATSATPTSQVGQDAAYTINGFSSTSSTNAASFNGLSIQLQGVGTTSLTASPNTTAIVQSITNFVQQFNTTLQTMQGYYNQTRDMSYLPLTAQQATQMTQDQITKWNEKAQSGLLSNDMLLGSAMHNVENVSSTILQGQTPSTINGQTTTLNSLASIGITAIDPLSGIASGSTAPGVTTTGWGSYGLLQVNTQQLTQAIQTDPQAVMRLFTNQPGFSGNVKTMDKGLAVQMYNSLANSIQQMTAQAGTSTNPAAAASATTPLPSSPIDPNMDFKTTFGIDSLDTSSLGQQISAMDSQATDMQTQVTSLKARYQSQFSNMETILSSLTTQSSFLGSLSGGSSSGTSTTGG